MPFVRISDPRSKKNDDADKANRNSAEDCPVGPAKAGADHAAQATKAPENRAGQYDDGCS